VGEVDQLEDAVDQRVAERDQRVDAADRDAEQEQVEELLRRPRRVLDQPEDDKRDEEEADERERADPPLPAGDEDGCLRFGRQEGLASIRSALAAPTLNSLRGRGASSFARFALFL
jgi:hypothetical protein